jgi:hypothetical protein
MQTYLGDPSLKTRFLDEIGKHEQMDAIVKGTYGEMHGARFVGCAIGCSLHSLNLITGKQTMNDKDSAQTERSDTGDHSRYESELGLPVWLAYLEDNVFENLPDDLAMTWPRRFAEAIPVGAVVDDVVLAKILRWVLADAEFGVRFATDNDEIRGYIDTIVVLFDAEIVGTATAEQREAAARDAWAAWAAWAACPAAAARRPGSPRCSSSSSSPPPLPRCCSRRPATARGHRPPAAPPAWSRPARWSSCTCRPTAAARARSAR